MNYASSKWNKYVTQPTRKTEGITPLVLNVSARQEWVVNITANPAPLPPAQGLGNYHTGGWVATRTSLDGLGE